MKQEFMNCTYSMTLYTHDESDEVCFDFHNALDLLYFPTENMTPEQFSCSKPGKSRAL